MKKVLRDITHSKSIIVIYALLFILLLVAAFVLVKDTASITRRYDMIIDTSLYKIRIIRENQNLTGQIQGVTIDKVFHPNSLQESDEGEMQQNLLKNKVNFDEFSKHISSKAEDSLFQKTKIAWQKYKLRKEKLTELNGDEKKALAYYNAEESVAYDNFQKTANELTGYLYNNIKKEDTSIDRFSFYSQVLINSLIASIIVLLTVLGMLVVKNVKKISQQHKALLIKEKELQESAYLYRSLFDKSPLPKWVCDRSTLQVYEVNDAALSLYGYSKEEFLSMTAFDLLPGEDREELRQRIQKTKNSGFHGYDRHIKRNGEIINVEIRVQLINYNGRPAGLVIGTDVTEKIKAETQIKESEELYRSLFNKNPLPVFVVDKRRMKILEANNEAVELYGYTKAELQKMTAFDIRDKEDHLQLIDLIDNKKVDEYKNNGICHVKKNGEKIIVDVIAETIHYKGEEAFLAIIRDVTKTVQLQKQLNEEKENKQKEITKAVIDGQEKERGELGKELHDNVNQILACAKLYLGSASKAEEEKKNELIEESKGLIDSGIQEIRKLSKSLVPPALTKSTLKDSIEELVDPLRITTDKKIETIFTMPDESVLCDKVKITIYRIIQEQMNNILKYADASKIQIVLKQDNYKLLLQVRDNGKGFDVKAKRKGIGLTNIANRAEVYNGKVVIDSAPGNGCTLSVFFPIEHLKHSGNGIIAMSAPGMAS